MDRRYSRWSKKEFVLAVDRFSLVSLRNKMSGREYQDASQSVSRDPILRRWPGCQRVRVGTGNCAVTTVARGNQGELQLDIELESAGLGLTKHYVVYPGTSVIREWLTMRTIRAAQSGSTQVDFLHSRVSGSIAQDLQFNYLTGGGNYNGSQLLKTEPMGSGYRRTLDSNGGIQPGNYSSYLPLVFLLNRSASEGLAVGWDYLGHWRFEIGDQEGVTAGHESGVGWLSTKTWLPAREIETPKVFHGAVFRRSR